MVFSQDECPERLAAAHGLCKINPDIKEANHHEDDPQKLSFHFSGCGVSLRRIPDRTRSKMCIRDRT